MILYPSSRYGGAASELCDSFSIAVDELEIEAALPLEASCRGELRR
jgi:hypothetical protein